MDESRLEQKVYLWTIIDSKWAKKYGSMIDKNDMLVRWPFEDRQNITVTNNKWRQKRGGVVCWEVEESKRQSSENGMIEQMDKPDGKKRNVGVVQR